MNNTDLQVRYHKETEQQVLQTGKQMNLYYTDEYVRWLEAKVLQQVSEVNSENEKALPINIVRVCAWEDAADVDKVPFLEKAAELAGDSMFCIRVWSAWGVGTMTDNDFVDAADDDDFVNDIAKAIWEGH